MIIALGTRKQVGKDTVGKYLIEKHGFQRLAFADALKNEVMDLMDQVGIRYNPKDESDKERFRPLLIAYSELRRSFDPEHWVKIILLTIDHIRNGGLNWVITDMRYPNEAQVLRDRGAIIVKINRDTGLPEEPTEAVGDLIKPDFEIDNNGTFDELYAKVDKILSDSNERKATSKEGLRGS